MRVAYSEEQIREATARLGAAINRDYAGRRIHLVGVLKGSFVFLADLARELRVPCSIDFVRLSSYGAAKESSGTVSEVMPVGDSVAGRHVLVVEEIVASGRTLAALLADLASQRPASLEVCALVDKTGRREIEIPVRYRGFSLEDGFLVGYGLDLDEEHRNLPAIYVVDDEEEGAEVR